MQVLFPHEGDDHFVDIAAAEPSTQLGHRDPWSPGLCGFTLGLGALLAILLAAMCVLNLRWMC